MVEQTNSNENETTFSGKADVQTLLASFRQVGLPLLQALGEVPGVADGEGVKSSGLNAAAFSSLIESTVTLSRELSNKLIGGEGQVEPWIRWALVGSASQVIAANYRATGKPLSAEEAAKMAAIAAGLQEQFKSQIPPGMESVASTVATFRAKMMETMVPVIGAVAQYAFGRAEHNLLAEVAERLVKTADQMTRSLAPSGASSEEWRMLCWNILRAAGQIYTECHYAEADRLLYMNPDERAAYFAQHGNVVPMTQVWQAFNQRMAMLATLATYLQVPDVAQLELQGWQ